MKAFALAKLRLSAVLSNHERAELARAMATVVIKAAEPLEAHVVCDDEEVAAFAESLGATVEWAAEHNLNGAVQHASDTLGKRGIQRIIVCHADLPFAQDLLSLAEAESTEVLLVTDRHCQGTNVLSVPTGTAFTFSYGPGSFVRHQQQAQRCELTARVVDSDALSWDVDEPEDLQVPADFSAFSPLLAGGKITAQHHPRTMDSAEGQFQNGRSSNSKRTRS